MLLQTYLHTYLRLYVYQLLYLYNKLIVFLIIVALSLHQLAYINIYICTYMYCMHIHTYKYIWINLKTRRFSYKCKYVTCIHKHMHALYGVRLRPLAGNGYCNAIAKLPAYIIVLSNQQNLNIMLSSDFFNMLCWRYIGLLVSTNMYFLTLVNLCRYVCEYMILCICPTNVVFYSHVNRGYVTRTDPNLYPAKRSQRGSITHYFWERSTTTL